MCGSWELKRILFLGVKEVTMTKYLRRITLLAMLLFCFLVRVRRAKSLIDAKVVSRFPLFLSSIQDSCRDQANSHPI